MKHSIVIAACLLAAGCGERPRHRWRATVYSGGNVVLESTTRKFNHGRWGFWFRDETSGQDIHGTGEVVFVPIAGAAQPE